MVGKFSGILVGYRKYDKASKDESGKIIVSEQKHVYDVFCTGVKKDKATGLFTDECKVVSVTDTEQVIKNMKYGIPVEFYGEAKTFKDKSGNEKSYMVYSDISAVGA